MFALHDNPKGLLQQIISTYWGQVTYICVDDSTIIGSDNCLPSGRHKAIIWTNIGILLNAPRGTNFSEILTKLIHFLIQENVFENVVWKMAASVRDVLRFATVVSLIGRNKSTFAMLYWCYFSLVEIIDYRYTPCRARITISADLSRIAKFMKSTWGPPGSCRSQMDPMLAQWTLLSVNAFHGHIINQ